VVRTNTEKQSEKDLNRKEKMTELVSKTVKKVNGPNVVGAILSGYCVVVLYNILV
tara:strand:+ start:392 stop:556 length:165 start_codon:yes stop_codon:yes gene_type:complete